MRPGLVLPLTLAVLALALSSASAQDERPLSYPTSWYGNTFGTADKWVQMAAGAMFVAADGTCYLNCFWDEAGREVGMYRDGDVVGIAGHTHGWGYNGGYAVTANGRYLFIAQVVDNEGGGSSPPTPGRRRARSGTASRAAYATAKPPGARAAQETR
jgi:hypothetical protein